MTALDQFPFAEVGLARRMGIPRTALRTARADLKKGEDWEIFGKSVQWSAAAVEWLAKKTGAILSTAKPGEPISEMVNGKAPPLAELTVLRKCVNPHALIATDDEGTERVVRVPRNEHFRPGMKIHAARSAAGYQLAGRCPRYPGRW